MKIAFASARGRIQTERNLPCQDIAGGFADQDLAAVVLADGAGSRKRAKESAECAVHTLLDYLRTRPLEKVTRKELWKTLCAAQKNTGLAPEDLGTTLVFAAAREGEYLAGHIGDGVILSGRKGSFQVLSGPENGRYINETCLLPDCGIKHFRLYRGNFGGSGSDSFLLATDGAGGILYDRDGRGAEVCRLIDEANREDGREECSAWLLENLEDIFSQYSSDDKSLAVLSL